MDIHYDTPPFIVELIKGSGEYQSSEICRCFSTDDPLSDACQIEVMENVDLKLRFMCADPSAKIYFDGTECMNSLEHQVDMDENGELYLAPSDTVRTIYANAFSAAMPANVREPLIPGRYRIRVSYGGTNYYAGYVVKPKQLSQQQLDIMRFELENALHGLAYQQRKRSFAPDEKVARYFPAHYLYQLALVENNFDQIMAVLSDLTDKVNFKVKKSYKLCAKGRGREIDEMTIRFQNTHPDQEDRLLCPSKEITYDLPENQWLKKIIHKLNATLSEIDDAFQSAIDRAQAEPLSTSRQETSRELARRQSALRKMRSGLNVIKHSAWYSTISPGYLSAPPHAMIDDARYRLLYNIYRQLSSDDITVKINSDFVRHWKSSDVLYELWGFFKVEEMLISLGFQPQDGWIYAANPAKDPSVIPTIAEGTKIVLAQEDILLDMYYNAMIPEHSSDTLYLTDTPHNKPDCRLDVFWQGRYLGSLVIEFKYRPVSGFWRPKEYNKKPEATKQLIAYFNNSGSQMLLHGKLRAVQEVWAVYPKEDRFQERSGEFNETCGIRLMRLTPGESTAFFAEQLKIVLDKLIAENRMVDAPARH